MDDCLFTNQYLDGVCEEINEELQQKMKITMADISSKFSFPINFIKTTIQNKLGTIIQGTLIADGQQLTTLGYQQIMVAKLRGILRATIKPTSLNYIVRTIYNIEI